MRSPGRCEQVRQIFCEECQTLTPRPCYAHARITPDKLVIPYSVASLPESLCLHAAVDDDSEKAVFARESIPALTIFGPLMGSVTSVKPAECAFACGNAQNEELRYFQLDSDQTSNWMKHVRFASNSQECNLAVFEVPQSVPFWQPSNGALRMGMVIFVTIRRILPNEELKIAYSWDYTSRIGRGYLGNTATENNTHAANAAGAVISSGLPADITLMDNLASDFINFDVSSTTNRDLAMDFTPVVPGRTYDGFSECPDDKGVSDSESLNDCLSLDEECLVQANVEATEASECTVFDTENAAFLGRTATASPVSNLHNDDALSEMSVRHLDDGSDLPLTVSLEADSGETVDWNQDSLKTKKHLQSRKKGKCLVCGRYFKYLVSHLNTTHTEEDVRAVDDACFLCHRKFQSHKGFGVHLKMAHRRVPPLDETARLAALDYIQRTGCLHYRCADCRKVFTSEALLNIHAFAHDTDGSRLEEQPERKCPGCTFTGPTFAELLEHTGQHSRTLGKQHQCILCGMLVDSLIRHADAQHPEVRQILQEKWSFECSECSQTFIDMVRLKVHMNKSHQRTRCLYCGFRGPTMNALIKHVKQHRVDRLFPCQWCGISYKKYDALVVHVRESHSDVLNQLTEEHTETVGNDYTTAAAPESATLTEFIEHKQETSMFSYYCDSCHLHFPIKALWDLHKIHHYSDSKELDQRPERRCPACDFEAACFADLMHHSKEHGLSPTDKKPCAVCGGHFRYLKRHFRTQHPEILQRLEENWEFVCDECGERFKSENNLNFHIKTVHVGGFQCLYCAKLFRSLLELGLHARPEHSVNGEYPCLSCDKKFGSYSLARQHYRERHDVMQMKTCEICQDVCRGKRQLAEHMESVHDVQTKVNKSKIEKKRKRPPVSHMKTSAGGKRVEHMKNANGAQKRVRKVKKEKKRKRPRVTFNKTPAGGYECPECGKVLKCHNSLYNHKRNVHYFGKSQAEWDKILLSGEVSQKFLEESRKSRLTCDECGIVCSTDYCLYRHKRWKHVGDFKEKFEKDRAEKKRLGIYTHWQTYKKPRDRMAFADFPHKCHMCQLGFMREIALKKHNATQHSGDSAQQS